jgi:hypothetical protein
MTKARFSLHVRPLACAALAMVLSALNTAASAATLDESVVGDFSGNRLAPTVFALDSANGGNNTFAGRIGRQAGVIDLDYITLVVPSGFLWTALIVGNQTTVGGGGSFIGLASGPTMPVLTSAIDATGLLGYRVYGTGDRGTDILDDMAIAGNGSSGFARPLGAGTYTLWIQELSTGDFNYSFNATLAPVPEPASALLILLGLAGTAAAAHRAGRR